MKGLDDHLQCKTLGDSFDFFSNRLGRYGIWANYSDPDVAGFIKGLLRQATSLIRQAAVDGRNPKQPPGM